MDERGIPRSRGGTTSPRWIQQLLNGNFDGSSAILNPEVVGAAFARGDVSTNEHHRHILTVLGTQSSHGENPPPAVFHGVCIRCDYHFVIRTFTETVEGLCREPQDPSAVTEGSRPLHHLVWVSSASSEEIASARSKYYPLATQAAFQCSSCPFQVTVEISEPRLALDERRLLEDVVRVQRNISEAKNMDPSRYDKADETWFTKAASTLNTYLGDVLSGNNCPISQHNKIFATVLGPECYPLLARLGFTDGNHVRDGVDVPVFIPPIVPSVTGGVTNCGTERAFLEDFRAEIENITHRNRSSSTVPEYGYSYLERMLGCQNFHRNHLERSTPIYPTLDNPKAQRPEPAEFAVLGAMQVFCEQYIFYAYQRQRAVWDESHWSSLTRSLGNIASNQGVFAGLAERAAIEASLLDFDKPPPRTLSPEVRHAMSILNVVDPALDDQESIIKAFYKKVTEAPAQIEFLRSMLITISNDPEMQMPDLGRIGGTMLPKHVALRIFKLDTGTEPSTIADRATSMLLENPGKEALHRVIKESVLALSYYYNDSGLAILAENLQSSESTKTAAFQVSSNQLPAGLINIGNTCYLNSILQLLFSCKPIRNVVMGHDAIRLRLADESISIRRLGGNRMPLDRAEGIISQVFLKELSELFLQLGQSSDVAIKPSQLLANSALISTSRLLGGPGTEYNGPVSTPPPPQTRSITLLTTVGESDQRLQSQGSYNDRQESAATPSASTETLVTSVVIGLERESEAQSLMSDNQMEAARASPGYDHENSKPDNSTSELSSELSLEEAKDRLEIRLAQQTRSSGTEQQDFEEVHGRILNLIQASIEPSRVVEDVQWDQIMDTFYVTVANYTQSNEGVLNVETVSDRYVTAFPAETGSCTLYEALDRNFDRQDIEGSHTLRWSSIRRSAPILNVLIQRSQTGGSKNRNQVTIPDTLDLSRYMDCQSPLTASAVSEFGLLPVRSRVWHINSRIESLQALKTRAGNSLTAEARMFVSSSMSDDVGCTHDQSVGVPTHTDVTDLLGLNEVALDGLSGDKITAIIASPRVLPSTPISTPGQVNTLGLSTLDVEDIQTQIAREVDQLRRLKEDMLASASVSGSFDAHDTIYHLHAVICHSGGMQAGHYWIWIKDHERGIWRKYNDSNITEETNAAEVLARMGGDPYYLCYVRAHDREMHVDSPIRPWARPQPQSCMSPQRGIIDEDGDVVIFQPPLS
jgi:ubiquitin carboxyl-terminal hydrolase 25/28